MDRGSTNVLSLGENRISLDYNAKIENRLVRTFSQAIDLRISMLEYPDDWSGFVSVWGSYMPYLTIIPEEWHLDIHYVC